MNDDKATEMPPQPAPLLGLGFSEGLAGCRTKPKIFARYPLRYRKRWQ